MTDSDLRALYDEELAVAKDAISNLRTSFRCDYHDVNLSYVPDIVLKGCVFTRADSRNLSK